MEIIDEITNFIWGAADLIRDTFTRRKYQDIILPFTVLRRIDCILEPTKEKVLETNRRDNINFHNINPQLCEITGYTFYNTSIYTFSNLLENGSNLAVNLCSYIDGFSNNIREVLEKFHFEHAIRQLDEAGLLYLVMTHFKNVDLHPDKISNHMMSLIFEDLIRKFNELLNDNPGEHFTSRDVIRLMVAITLAKDSSAHMSHITRNIYDPCCGTGGILTIGKEEILKENPEARVYLYGQEINSETFAVCKSHLYMKSIDGEDAERIMYGSTLSNDRHPHEKFHHIYANPPYGKDWKREEGAIKQEVSLSSCGRFSAGTPRISDSQFLFLQHMLSHMYDPEKDVSHVAIVMNGSPLFIGDAGSGESEIRRWVLENDWLEAIIALPEQLFYNTGIATYIWILTNRKTKQRRGKVQLINAADLYCPMSKGIGSKRRYISDKQIKQISDTFISFDENERSKILDYTAFGYRRIIIERPLRLNFQVNPQRINRLWQQKAFIDLAINTKGRIEERTTEEGDGRKKQEAILVMLRNLPDLILNTRITSHTVFKDRAQFEEVLNNAIAISGLKLSSALKAAIIAALSERDENASIFYTRNGFPEADSNLRDIKDVPLIIGDSEEIVDFYSSKISLTKSTVDFIRNNVLSNYPDAWVNFDIRDHKDGQVGRVGFLIDFSLYAILMQQYKLQERARNLGMNLAVLSDFAQAIHFAHTKDAPTFESYSNAIYIPLQGTNDVITTISESGTKFPSNYAQIVLDADKAIASYVAQFLNQDIGQLIRSQIMVGSHKTDVLRRKLSQLPIYLPGRNIQALTIEVDTKITNIISELKEFQVTAWSKPYQLKRVIASINTLKREERLSDWFDHLPFPLASILWRYNTSGDNYKIKYETLLQFFEALAEFIANLLLSGFITDNGLFNDICQHIKEILPPNSLNLATFGNWVKITEYLSKMGRRLLHGTDEAREQCTTMFRTKNIEILEMLFASDVITILQQTNAHRNEWTGHGGITSQRDNRDRCTILENHLSKLRNVFTTKWEQYVLIRPGISKYMSGIYDYKVELIMGCRVPFEEINVKTAVPMEDNNLYMLSSNELNPLKILPIVKITTQNICYFYNRHKKDGNRFVSYHSEEKNEIMDSSEDKDIQMLIRALSK